MCTCGIDMACDREQPEEHVRIKAQVGARACGRELRALECVILEAAAEHQEQRQHGENADDADHQLVLPPAFGLDKVPHEGRPNCTPQVVAGGADGNGDATPAREPVRDVRDQGREGSGAADADQEVREGEHRQARRQSRGDEPSTQKERTGDERGDDAQPVDQAADGGSAESKAEHRERVGERSVGARDTEIGLHRGQRDHIGPQPDATDGPDKHRCRQPQPGIGGLAATGVLAQYLCRDVHGRGTIRAYAVGVKHAAWFLRSRHACAF
jgi:hypothetical protein